MTQQNEESASGAPLLKYVSPDPLKAFGQCEILSNVAVPLITVGDESDITKLPVTITNLPFCMVMSQDCDLERDFDQYKKDKGTALRHILLCELLHTDDQITSVSNGMGIKTRDLKEQLPRDPHLRHGFLEKLDGKTPELLADFRMVYGIQPNFLYYQMEHNTSQRLIRLNSPYKEYFSQRFYFYLNRVALQDRYTSV
ncbi:MAG: hypothetical protein KGI29_07540 [Pseudomonadota bacterium]|nr:hypothetical protein [Pseudomonadota bacterium]